MKCENCKTTPNDSIMELFLCCLCERHYCFYCTNAYIKFNSELMKFSDKDEPIESIEFGYNNYRNIKNYVEKFYCEHCIK